jgi:hypothetical protein
MKVSCPHAPLLVARRLERHRASLNHGPKITVAIIASKPECGRGVNGSGVKNDGQSAKREGRDALVVETRLQLKNRLKPGDRGFQIANLEMYVIKHHMR